MCNDVNYLPLLFMNYFLIDRYVTKSHFGDNSIRAQFEEEERKIMGLMKTNKVLVEPVARYDPSAEMEPKPASSFTNQLEVSLWFR